MKTYMSKPIQFKNTTTLHLRKSIDRPSLRQGFPPSPSYGAAGLLIPLLLACFVLAPMAQAVGPDTDGNIPGSNNGEGIGVLVSRTGGVWNTGTGFEALNHLTAGNQNTATGVRALNSDINGGFNTATGVYSLFSNTSGFFNSASGAYALASNISGNYNTANGYAALYRNTTGNQNTDYGYAALYNNTTGRFNTATGSQALFSNTAGSFHTAIGFGALYSNTYGDENTGGNTAIGAAALTNNTTGGGNTAIGESALVNSVTGNQNIALGYVAAQNLTDGSNNIHVSNPGVPTESNTIRIGNVVPFTDIYGFPHAAHSATYIAGINGATASGGVAVYINSDGKLGTLTSSARFKTEIKPMDESSTAILALKPVTFRYKHEIDPKDIPQFGLVAEEVEKVNPDLVSRDRDGKPYTVRYEAVNAMLLNEFLKEHRTVQEQEATIAQLKSTIAQQMEAVTARLKEHDAQIQKVSAQVEVSRPAPQTVVDNQ
jgi:hypothetical protein